MRRIRNKRLDRLADFKRPRVLARDSVSLYFGDHKARSRLGTLPHLGWRLQLLAGRVARKNIRYLETCEGRTGGRGLARALGETASLLVLRLRSLPSIIILPSDRQYRHTRTAYVRETLSRYRALSLSLCLSHGAFTRFNPCRRLLPTADAAATDDYNENHHHHHHTIVTNEFLQQ